jgi:hypothetical protein
LQDGSPPFFLPPPILPPLSRGFMEGRNSSSSLPRSLHVSCVPHRRMPLRLAACASPVRTRRRAGLLRVTAARQRTASPWWTRRLDSLSSSGGVERTPKRSEEGAEARSRRSK